jgi:hypothetical protein
MKKIIFLIFAITIYSCKSLTTAVKINCGTYFAKGDDYNHSLILNSDSTFVINFKYFEVNSSCDGKWNVLGKDTLILSCYKPLNSYEVLQSGYLNEREIHLKILNENNLLFKNINFKRY